MYFNRSVSETVTTVLQCNVCMYFIENKSEELRYERTAVLPSLLSTGDARRGTQFSFRLSCWYRALFWKNTEQFSICPVIS